jgi:hypothetical protein
MNETQRRWISSPMPAVTIPAAVSAELARTLRAEAERAGYGRYSLLDRGSYEVLELEGRGAAWDEVARALVGIAREVTGRPLVFALAAARVLRLRAGDYLLVRHDRVAEGPAVELVLDLSPAPVPSAEVHWRHRGQVYFTFPSSPGALALVERGPTVLANHTYVSRMDRAAEVVRLVAMLAEGRT